MTDRLKTAFEDVVRGTMTQLDGEFDPRGWYPAEVVSWNNGKVDVRFDNRDIGTKAGVPLAPGVGVTRYQIAQGTRVLVAWQGGDIRFPFVAAAWLQRGGLVNFTQEFTGTYILGNPAQADGVVTKKDLQQLFAAISGTTVTPNDGGAAFKSSLLTALTMAGWSGGSGGGQLASNRVKVIR